MLDKMSARCAALIQTQDVKRVLADIEIAGPTVRRFGGYSRACAINSLKRLGGRRKEFRHGAFGLCVLVMPEIISGIDLRWTWRTRRKNAPKNLLRRPGQRFQHHEHEVGVTSAHN
jgi:hypothetical protein